MGRINKSCARIPVRSFLGRVIIPASSRQRSISSRMAGPPRRLQEPQPDRPKSAIEDALVLTTLPGLGTVGISLPPPPPQAPETPGFVSVTTVSLRANIQLSHSGCIHERAFPLEPTRCAGSLWRRGHCAVSFGGATDSPCGLLRQLHAWLFCPGRQRQGSGHI